MAQQLSMQNIFLSTCSTEVSCYNIAMSNPPARRLFDELRHNYIQAHPDEKLSRSIIKQRLKAQFLSWYEKEESDSHSLDEKKKSEIDSNRSNEYAKAMKMKEKEKRMDNQGHPDAASQMSKIQQVRRNLSQKICHLRRNYHFARSRPKLNLDKQSKTSNIMDYSLQTSQNQSGENSRQIKQIPSLKKIPLNSSQQHDFQENPVFFKPKITKNEKKLAQKGGQSKLKRMNRNQLQRKAIQRQAPPHAIYQQPKDKARQNQEALWAFKRQYDETGMHLWQNRRFILSNQQIRQHRSQKILRPHDQH